MLTAGVSGLRSVQLGVTDLTGRENFYTRVWHLSPVAKTASSVYLRGTGEFHHLLGLHSRSAPELLRLDFAVPSRAGVDALHAAIGASGVEAIETPAELSEPAGGYGFAFKDPEGRTIQIVADDVRHKDAPTDPDRPTKITHVVLNSSVPDQMTEFYCRCLGFEVIDRTVMLTFLRCNDDHHTIAFARAEHATLHHIAFELKDLDSVMRGAGRMRDNGFQIEWGIGRHGPGDNVFAYFVGPDDVVIEYTAEVKKVDKTYKVGQPSDWIWPPGRNDQWGIAVGPTERLKAAQKKIGFSWEIFHPG